MKDHPSDADLVLEALTASRDDPDVDCPFRKSSIYRKIFVYPSLGDSHWSEPILSDHGRRMTTIPSSDAWPWLVYDAQARANATSHYDIDGQHVQYATELLVRELMTNADSCLRTFDPDEADLFYVPYLPSMEFHQGSKTALDYSTSKYGQAIMDILYQHNYTAWEHVFGLTAEYWRRRNGSDHILVFSEPLHGLLHTRNKRGHFHYIRTQQQTAAPIVISVELSASFVAEYPHCSRSNILMPYPNTDGRVFNGVFQREALEMAEAVQRNLSSMAGAMSTRDAETYSHPNARHRPATVFYSGGNHGTCPAVRRNLEKEVYHCSKSFSVYHKHVSRRPHHGMWLSTFCPTPGGDSPSAKRMFDAILMGCIPVVLSHDFVWPFTKDFDSSVDLDPESFSVRMNASDFESPVVNYKSCQSVNPLRPGILDRLKQIPQSEIERLQLGLANVANSYAWYQRAESLPDNPLRDGVLPTGGTAYRLVHELELRARGVRWPACKREYGANPWTKQSTKKFRC